MNLVRQAVKITCSTLLPPTMFLTRGPKGGRRSGGQPVCCEVALTFDDGPEPDTTPGLLEQLEKQGIRATFFLIGEKAVRHRDIVESIVAAGHQLGNHTYFHSEPAETSTVRFLDEVRRTRDLLEEISGSPCTLVRPPKGVLTVSKQLALWREGMTVVLWNADPRDYRMRSIQEAQAWVTAYRPRMGDVVLLHDNHPWAGHIAAGMAAGRQHYSFRFVRLSEWLTE